MLETYKKNNPNGKIYMKLDLNRYWLSRIIHQPYFNELLQLCDLISSECSPIQKIINDTIKSKCQTYSEWIL